MLPKKRHQVGAGVQHLPQRRQEVQQPTRRNQTPALSQTF